MRRTVPVSLGNSTVNGSGSAPYADWWRFAAWQVAWADDGYVPLGGSSILKVPSGRAIDDGAVYRVRPAARLGRRAVVRSVDLGDKRTGCWCWEPV